MITLITKRVLWSFFVVFIITILIFFLLRTIPGDPARLMAPHASDEVIENIREEMGLSGPIITQYIRFIKDALKGNFGDSLYYNSSVIQLIYQGFVKSMPLLIGSTFISLAVSMFFGVTSALRPKSFFDRLVFTLSVVLKSIPTFWIGLVLIIIFAFNLGWLPGFGDTNWKYFILPLITLSIPLIPGQLRTIKGEMEDVTNKTHYKFAKARGLKKNKLIWKYGFSNIIISLLAVLSVQVGVLLGEIIIVEWIFNIQGIGLMLLYSVFRRDYPLLQGIVVVFALLCSLSSVGVDILRIIVDPRISKEEQS